MELQERVSSAIRAQTDLLEPFTPDVATIRGAARRQTRRRAVLAAVAAMVAVVVVVTAGLVNVDRSDQSVPPANRRQQNDGVAQITIPDYRAEQVVVNTAEPVPVRMGHGKFSARGRFYGSGSYSVTTVAAAATGARELSFRVAPSTTERLVQASDFYTERFFSCGEKGRTDYQSERCTPPTVKLLIDGQPVEDQFEGPFSGLAGWGPLTPGSSHRITFRVTRGDPRNVDLGVVVYEKYL